MLDLSEQTGARSAAVRDGITLARHGSLFNTVNAFAAL